jgi:hypothetical protein
VLAVRLVAQELAQDLEQAATLFLIRLPPTGAAEGQVFLLQQAQQFTHHKQVVLAVVVLVEVILEPLVILHLQALHKVIVVVTERALEM